MCQTLCCLNRFGHHRPNGDDRHIGMRTRAQCVRARDHVATTAFPRGRIARNACQVLVHGPGGQPQIRRAAALTQVPEVVEVQGLSGTVDLLIEVVARDADDLYRIAGRILDIRGVRRTRTSLVMRGLVDYRLGQLIGG